MAGFTVQLQGAKQIEKLLQDKTSAVSVGASLEIKAATQTIERNAKRLAPVNFGTLRQSILARNSGLTGEVEVKATYAPYIEFGTQGQVKVPSGYEAFARQFQGGTGGGVDEMLQSLTDWVSKKGLAGTYSTKTRRRLGGKARKAQEDQQVAYAIMLSILRKGIPAQPFLIPAYVQEKPNLLKRLKKYLQW